MFAYIYKLESKNMFDANDKEYNFTYRSIGCRNASKQNTVVVIISSYELYSNFAMTFSSVNDEEFRPSTSPFFSQAALNQSFG